MKIIEDSKFVKLLRGSDSKKWPDFLRVLSVQWTQDGTF